MKSRTYTDDMLIEIVKQSTSIRQVLIKLNLKSAGGNYKIVNNRIKFLSIDTSHFTGKGWSKDKTLYPKRKIEDYLSNKLPIQSYKLKNRLLKDNLLSYVCSSCNLHEWLGNPIPLELDHIDGNHLNNILSNLRLLCPNCHALTPTYRGKNKNKTSNSTT